MTFKAIGDYTLILKAQATTKSNPTFQQDDLIQYPICIQNRILLNLNPPSLYYYFTAINLFTRDFTAVRDMYVVSWRSYYLFYWRLHSVHTCFVIATYVLLSIMLIACC